MEWLLILLTLETGIPGTNGVKIVEHAPIELRESFFAYPEGSMYIDIDIEAEAFGFLHLAGGVKTWMLVPTDITSPWFYPYQARYDISAWASIGFLDIGARHWCQHEVDPTNPTPIAIPKFDASNTEFFIRAQFQLGGTDESF